MALVARWSGRAPDQQLPAPVVILMGAVENYRRTTWTYVAAPLDLDDATFVNAWVQMCSSLLGSPAAYVEPAAHS